MDLGHFERLNKHPSLLVPDCSCDIVSSSSRLATVERDHSSASVLAGGANLMYTASLTCLSLSSLIVSRILTSSHSMM